MVERRKIDPSEHIVSDTIKETFFMSIYFAGYEQSPFAKERLYDQPRNSGRNADDGCPDAAARASRGGYRLVDAVESFFGFSLGRDIPSQGNRGVELQESDRVSWKTQGKTDPATDRDVAQTGNGARIRFGFVDRPTSQEADQKELRCKVSRRLHASLFETAGIGSQESGAPGVGARSSKDSPMAKTDPAQDSKAGKAIRRVDPLRRRGCFLLDSSCGQDLDVSRSSSDCPGFGTKGHLGWGHLGSQSPGPSGV